MKVFIVTQKSPNIDLILGSTKTLQEASQVALKQVTLLLSRAAITCLVIHDDPLVWFINDIIIRSDGAMIDKCHFTIEIHELEL